MLLEFVKSFLGILKTNTPFLKERLKLTDIFMDFVQENRDGLLLAISELPKFLQGLFVALGRNGRSGVFLEKLLDDLDFSQGLFPLVDLHREL